MAATSTCRVPAAVSRSSSKRYSGPLEHVEVLVDHAGVAVSRAAASACSGGRCERSVLASTGRAHRARPGEDGLALLEEGAAQRLVALHHGREGRLQLRGVERALEGERQRHDIGRRLGALQRVPEPLLHQRGGDARGARAGRPQLHLALGRGAQPVRRVPPRWARRRRRSAAAPRRRPGARGPPAAWRSASGRRARRSRPSRPTCSSAEHLAEELRQQLLHGPAGRLAQGPRRRGLHGQRGQRLAVHLAVGREGQRVEHGDARGHHGARAARAARDSRSVSSARAASASQATKASRRVSRPPLAREHHRLTHAGLAQQGGLHLLQLDAHAAHLHLEVGAAQEAQRAVRRSTAPGLRCGRAARRGRRRTGPGTKRSAVSAGRPR